MKTLFYPYFFKFVSMENKSRKMRSILTLVSILVSAISFSQITSYNYQFEVKGAPDTVYLANYFGKQLYYNDTAYATNGKFAFKKNREIKPGEFAVVFPGQTYFQVVINEPAFTIKTDTTDIVENMVVEGSLENKLLYDFRKYLKGKISLRDELTQKYKDEENEKKKEALKDQLIELDKEVKSTQRKIIEDNPQTLVSQIMLMGMDVEVPDPPKDENGNITDSTFQYRYYRDNFWEGINLKNDAVVRSTTYHNKYEKYLDKVLIQHPDTIAKYVDKFVGEMDPMGDLFKYTVNHTINKYSKSKIMGMDAMFVHMALNYYATGKAHWADTATVNKITDKANSLYPTLIGKPAPPMNLFDTTGKKVVPLYNVNADYTVLYIWSSSCGHCKKATPKLKKIYDVLKPFGVEVYGVGNELENDGWKKFIREHDLNWINVSDTPERPNGFRTTYDVYATPKIYILDKDKKIIAKQVGVEQVGDILKHKLNKPDLDFGIEPADPDEEHH